MADRVEGRESYQYALWRVVPSLQRGEALNAGVVVFARRLRFLDARVGLDRARLGAVAPDADADALDAALAERLAVARGLPDGGAVAALEPSERFGWLVAPSSTVVQPSQVHTGLCDDPDALLEHLFLTLVT